MVRDGDLAVAQVAATRGRRIVECKACSSWERARSQDRNLSPLVIFFGALKPIFGGIEGDDDAGDFGGVTCQNMRLLRCRFFPIFSIVV
jgi:hypothetical protein